MKARVKTRVLIDADAAAVFKYLSHTKYHHLWNPHLRSIRPLEVLQQGSEYETTSLVLGVRTKAVNHVTKFIQDQELEVENKTGMLHYCVSYHLEASGKATRLICITVVFAESKAFAFARPMMEHLARRELNSDLQALKKAVETKQT